MIVCNAPKKPIADPVPELCGQMFFLPIGAVLIFPDGTTTLQLMQCTACGAVYNWDLTTREWKRTQEPTWKMDHDPRAPDMPPS